MRPTRTGGSFSIIGENIHATRSVLRTGRHVAVRPDGSEAIRFQTGEGDERFLAIPDALRTGTDFGKGKVKHVQAALLVLLQRDQVAAADARAYIETLARRQVRAGADYLDLNVDELAPDPAVQEAAMRLLVEIVEGLETVPPALDSSSSSAIRAGLEASRSPGRLLLNSASVERLDVLDLAAASGAPVVVTAAGEGGLPADADERVANTERIVGEATRRGIALDHLYIDALVIPVAVNPDAAAHFLETAVRIRAGLGRDVHITGGLSNVSFGLPARRLVNDVFIDLAVDAGVDAGIVDPVASDATRVFSRDRGSPAYLLAAALLSGADPYGMEFLLAFRSGALGEEG